MWNRVGIGVWVLQKRSCALILNIYRICSQMIQWRRRQQTWDQDVILLIDYLPKCQTINAEYYSSLLVQLKDVMKEKLRGSSPRGSCSCTTMPRLTGHLQPRRNWPTWDSNALITHPILWIWPRWTTNCSLDWKNNWKVAIFRPTRRSLLPRRPGWRDNRLNFFFLTGLQKLEQRAKKCIELHGEYVE